MQKHCGFVSIIGKPNVGKSTVLNAIMAKKVSIITHKAQTTRHHIRAIKNTATAQIIFSDTPGLEHKIQSNLNRHLNKTAQGAAQDADLIIFLVSASTWNENDTWALEHIKDAKRPTILVINKVDHLAHPDDLLPLMQKLNEKYDFLDVVPISALKDASLDPLLHIIEKHLPEQAPLYPETQDHLVDENLIISEGIREQLIKNLHQEIPYELTVQTEKIEEKPEVKVISAIIWVHAEGQKRIVIGKKGHMLKIIGTAARKNLENFFGKKIHLSLWVKIKSSWWEDNDFIEKTKA